MLTMIIMQGRILGIDPGTLVTGFGIVEERRGDLVCVTAGFIETKSAKTFAGRLLKIGEGLQEIMKKYTPTAVALEKTFYAKNVDSATKLGHARGVCMYEAARQNLPVFEYTPTEIKSGICGSGRAEKHQVDLVVRTLLGLKSFEKLDVTDALALAVFHLRVSETAGRIKAQMIKDSSL